MWYEVWPWSVTYFSNELSKAVPSEYEFVDSVQVASADGFVIIEHSEQHSVVASGKMDPFGVETNFFPYLLSQWFGHKISIDIINNIKQNKNNAPMCFFIIKKNY